jgi:Trypsin-like peptidase domain/Right handed beta helix region
VLRIREEGCVSRPTLILVLLLLIEGTFCYSQTPSLSKFVYTVTVPKTAKHKALVQTGFRLAGTKGIITCLHGLADATTVTAYNESGDLLKGLVVSLVDVRADLVLLRSDELEARPADGLRLSSAEIGAGTEVIVFGHPVGINLYRKTANVATPAHRPLSDLIPPSSAIAFGERHSPASDMMIISIDGNLVPGDSGAPVLDAQNGLLGVVDGGLLGGAAAISWAIPIGAVNWRNAASAHAEVQQLANLESGNLFAFQDDTALAVNEVVVSMDGDGQYTSIKEALAHLTNGGKIIVRPGTYSDNDLHIDKSINLIGDGSPEDIILNGRISIGWQANVMLKNVTISGGYLFGVEVVGRVTIENCNITSRTAVNIGGIAERYAGATAVIRHSNLTASAGDAFAAVSLASGTHAQIAESIIVGTGDYGGVQMSDNSSLIIDKSTITGKHGAFVRSGPVSLTVKNSDLRNNPGGIFVRSTVAQEADDGSVIIDENNRK